MRVLHRLDDLALPRSWVTVGGFDGVHRGHQALIRRTVEGAQREQALSVVVTFDPLPAVFFRRRPARYLTPLREKLPLLEALGVDIALVLTFDQRLAETPARVFLQALRQRLGMVTLVAGPYLTLGRNREGTVERIQAWAPVLGFRVEMVEPVRLNGERISASLVRNLLTQGRVDKAATCLGRWYTLTGPVRPGARRGQHLGFPTANVLPPQDKWLPAEGVYAGWSTWEGADQWHPAVANLGHRPTFDSNGRPLLEVHLLEWAGTLYHKRLTFAFVQHIRGERRFPSVQALRAQIARDVLTAQEVLRHAAQPASIRPLHP